MAEKLFTEFPPVSTERWEEVIVKDLKGADYDKKLVWKTQEGFSVRPYYRAENLSSFKHTNSEPGDFPYVRGSKNNNNWLIRQDYCTCEGIENANKLALDGLMKGVESVGFYIQDGKITKDELNSLLKGIKLDAIEVNFKGCRLSYTNILSDFIAICKEQKCNMEDIKASFDFDPLHTLTTKGFICKENAFEIVKGLVEVAAEYKGIRVINVNAYDYNNAGASISQELAFALNMGSEYLSKLTELGLEAAIVAKKIKFTFGVGSTYFMEIAKFRAARLLWANIVDAYGSESNCSKKMNIHAVTSQWNQTIYDSYVNMLRNTTEAMSAAIAGVDSLEVLPFDYSFRAPAEFSNRISRNVQSVLKEEAHFDKIVDPSAGSYFVENLTDSIIKVVWDLFKAVEDKKGYIEAFKEGFIQSQVKAVADKKDQDIAKRKQTILGSNQYPNFLEKVEKDITKEMVTRGACKAETTHELIAQPLEAYRAAQAFEELRFTTDKAAKQPQAFMLTFGNLAMCRARAQFSCNFFAVAGFKVVDNNRFSTIEEGVEAALKANANIIVACSSDDEYLEAAPRIAELVGNKAVVVVAGDPACKAELEEKGVKNFINVRCNVLETLKEYQKMMGINE